MLETINPVPLFGETADIELTISESFGEHWWTLPCLENLKYSLALFGEIAYIGLSIRGSFYHQWTLALSKKFEIQ